MSKWAHIAGIIRFDGYLNPRTASELIRIIMPESPTGSEGGLSFYGWDNSMKNHVAFASVSFHGDLRDFSTEDHKEVGDWVEAIYERRSMSFNGMPILIRQIIIQIDYECGDTFIYSGEGPYSEDNWIVQKKKKEEEENGEDIDE